jgi:SAM-dependent methyltransferase
MYDTAVSFAGVKLAVDRIDRRRSDDSDNVMPIFWEEQPFTWRFIQPFVRRALAESKGSLDFLDVGTGCGIFGILMAKIHRATVVAVDKSPRAIRQAKTNARMNGVTLKFRHELYGLRSAPNHGVKIIGLYPPYHLYPKAITPRIPQHARGGSDGQVVFRDQLRIANHHLAPDGIIFFNQMCLGDERGPAFLKYIPELIIGRPSIEYTNVFPRIRTATFLREVYGNKHAPYVASTSRKFPWLYYTVGIIRRDGKGVIQVVRHHVPLRGRNWPDRILLHREIAAHESRG